LSPDRRPSELPPLSLHDALPICASIASWRPDGKNRTVDYRLIAAAFFLAAFLCGCGGSGKGLPADRAEYVGEWQSREMYLLITEDRKSTRLNSSHQIISYAVFCL